MRLLLWIPMLCYALHSPAQRVISLAPNLTETCWALGAGDLLVGVTDHCTFPEAVRQVPKVGGYLTPNLETIISLEPDLILAVPEHLQLTRQLTALGYRVETIRNWSLADIQASVYHIGSLLGKSSNAEKLLEQLKDADRRMSSKPLGVTCLMIIGREQANGHIRSVFAVARAGFLHELLTRSGASNVYPRETPYFAQLSQEAIIDLNPDVIVELLPQEPLSKEQQDEYLAPWYQMRGIKAVESHRIHVIAYPGVLTPGPRYPETQRLLMNALGRE